MLMLHQRTQVRHQHLRNLVHDVSGIFTVLARVSLSGRRVQKKVGVKLVAVRIYSLAKELKLDSKELVELCTRAGIQDKGSALASLDDAEVSRIKEFVLQGNQRRLNGRRHPLRLRHLPKRLL